MEFSTATDAFFVWKAGADLGFSREGGYSKKKSKNLSTLFLDRRNSFSELFQITVNTPF